MPPTVLLIVLGVDFVGVPVFSALLQSVGWLLALPVLHFAAVSLFLPCCLLVVALVSVFPSFFVFALWLILGLIVPFVFLVSFGLFLWPRFVRCSFWFVPSVIFFGSPQLWRLVLAILFLCLFLAVWSSWLFLAFSTVGWAPVLRLAVWLHQGPWPINKVCLLCGVLLLGAFWKVCFPDWLLGFWLLLKLLWSSFLSGMFVVGLSYVFLLQAVVSQCDSVSVAYLCEVADDGAVLAGIEVELPPLNAEAAPRHVFFWSCPHITCMAPYEQAAFQAVSFLQMLYGFLVINYSYQSLLYYRRVAQSAVEIAANAIRWVHAVGSFICAQPVPPADVNEFLQVSFGDCSFVLLCLY
ncbi:uncharacterized protein LOC133890183 [Phragmites australis]|uniref:uncharacterized protein LOC133890183 n=1 Tax=Phragmites australis TaxID=29695 RepID=UPI002D787119|nr:uncharacterized protein LOC133890183 [Phragmites australis]